MNRDETPSAGPLDAVVPYVEPIYRYCLRRLGDGEPARDLAQEILAEALEGLRRGGVRNLDAWVWTVARNRYRRLFIGADAGPEIVALNVDDLVTPAEPGIEADPERAEARERVFRAVVGIAESYRRVLVAYHVRGCSYAEIARQLRLPMSSVKWRIHEGRRRLRERWEEMDDDNRIYDRIDWLIGCNGSMDPGRYLGRQVRRAICRACYERPLTVEEISRATAIPAVYVEDEIDALVYGEALTEAGGRYAATFIIQSLAAQRRMAAALEPLAAELASASLAAIRAAEPQVRALAFHGSDRPLGDLLWILVPRILRAAVVAARRGTPQLQGEYPARRDGGHGWFVIAERSRETHGDGAGQNSYGAGTDGLLFHYLWVGRYQDGRIDRALHDLSAASRSGFIADDGRIDTTVDETMAARLLEVGLAEGAGRDLRLAVPLLTQPQDDALLAHLDTAAEPLAAHLTDVVQTVVQIYRETTPARLHEQIRGVVGSSLNHIVGMVVGHLEAGGEMSPPPADQPHVGSVLAVHTGA